MKLLNFQDAKRLQRLSLNDLNRWVVSLYGSGYEDGKKEAEEQIKAEAAVVTEEQLIEILRTFRISEKRAAEIVEKIINGNL